MHTLRPYIKWTFSAHALVLQLAQTSSASWPADRPAIVSTSARLRESVTGRPASTPVPTTCAWRDSVWWVDSNASFCTCVKCLVGVLESPLSSRCLIKSRLRGWFEFGIGIESVSTVYDPILGLFSVCNSQFLSVAHVFTLILPSSFRPVQVTDLHTQQWNKHWQGMWNVNSVGKSFLWFVTAPPPTSPFFPCPHVDQFLTHLFSFPMMPDGGVWWITGLWVSDWQVWGLRWEGRILSKGDGQLPKWHSSPWLPQDPGHSARSNIY